VISESFNCASLEPVVEPRILLHFRAVSFPLTGGGPLFRPSSSNEKYFRFSKFPTVQHRQVTSCKALADQFLNHIR
jgi:hypothetical protein